MSFLPLATTNHEGSGEKNVAMHAWHRNGSFPASKASGLSAERLPQYVKHNGHGSRSAGVIKSHSCPYFSIVAGSKPRLVSALANVG
jgi:hypothetical protein